MEYKEPIKTQLDLLKKMGKSRRQIEQDLQYGDKYIDQALSRGGNKALYNALVLYKDSLEVIEVNNNVLNEEHAEYGTNMSLIQSMKQTIETQQELIKNLQMQLEDLKAKPVQKSKKVHSA